MSSKMTYHARILILVAMIFFAATLQADAQKNYEFNRRLDSILSVRYTNANIDTNYIVRPKTKWTLMGRAKMTGTRIESEGYREGEHFLTEMTADRKVTLSAAVSYLGMSACLAINPAKLLGRYHDYELNLRSYGKRFGFDFSYQDAGNFKGWYKTNGEKHDVTTSSDMFKLRTLYLNAYYIFNNRRFSYPAAFAHSYIQRRSTGSFLLAASGQGQHGKLNSDKMTMDFKMTNIGIGAGYGYNYVPVEGWLLHLSSLPTFIVYSNTSLTVDDTNVPLRYHFPEVIITARGSIVKQIGSNRFAGLSMVYNFTNIGNEESLAIHNMRWLVRTFFGVRL